MSSHFSFTNSLYDECNLDKKLKESVAPFNWITDAVYEHKDNCDMDASPFMHNHFKSIPSAAVDVEADLHNRNRLLSRCPETRFDPSKVVSDNKFSSKRENCKNQGLVPEYTRINKPCNIFSGISINRFHPLCEDLQDTNKIQSNSYIGTNTRLQIKDAFNEARLVQNSRRKFNSQLSAPLPVDYLNKYNLTKLQ
jgi:hypothetical protein